MAEAADHGDEDHLDGEVGAAEFPQLNIDDLVFNAPHHSDDDDHDGEGESDEREDDPDGNTPFLYDDDSPPSEVPDVFKCSICFEMLLDPTTINCGHSFCRICLARWFDARKSARQAFVCPECRKQWLAYPEIDYSLRSAMEIWYSPELLRRRRGVSTEDQSMVAQFASQAPATFANMGGARRVINQRILPINAQGVQFVLAILMNVALILGLILISLVAVIVSPGDEADVTTFEISPEEVMEMVDVTEWTVNDVDEWLKSLGPWTEDYRPAFRNSGIDGSWLILLDEDLLMKDPLNIPHRLIARRLHSEINNLRMSDNGVVVFRHPQNAASNQPTAGSHGGAEKRTHDSGVARAGKGEATESQDSEETVQWNRQKQFVFVHGLLNFPRTIILMARATLDYSSLPQLLNAAEFTRKSQSSSSEAESPDSNSDPTSTLSSVFTVLKLLILPQYLIIQQTMKHEMDGLVKWIMLVLFIRMYEELKFYMTLSHHLRSRNFLVVYSHVARHVGSLVRHFTLVLTIGYLYNVLPSPMMDFYTAYALGQPVGSALYYGLQMVYRNVPIVRNTGVRLVATIERSCQMALGYLLRFVFGFLIPQLIQLLQPAFRAGGGGNPPRVRRVRRRIPEEDDVQGGPPPQFPGFPDELFPGEAVLRRMEARRRQHDIPVE